MIYTPATLSNATTRTNISTKSKQNEHVQFVSTLSKGRNFTKNSFDIVAKRLQCRDNVRPLFVERIARLISFDNVNGD